MCGRYSLSVEPGQVEAHAGAGPVPESWQPSFNMAPTRAAPVVRVSPEGAREIRLARWGLPVGAADAPWARLAINARVDSLDRRRPFRRLVDARRCLIPADAFYEWRAGTGRRRQAFRIEPAGGGLFDFAGLWDRVPGPGGEPLVAFVMLTTQANARLSPVHDRMPVILGPEDRAPWLESGRALDTDLRRRLCPCPPEAIRLFPVGTAIHSTLRDGPDCARPVEEPPSFL